MGEQTVSERLAILEANSEQTLELLHDIRNYMTKTEVQEHRISLIETHCSNCDLNTRVGALERFCRGVKTVIGGGWIISAGLLINWLWGKYTQ